MLISLFIKKLTPYFIKKILYKNFSRLYWQSSFSSKWHKDRSQNDFELFAQVIFENTKHLNFDVIIEIGCGAGDLINFLNKKATNYKKIIGVDINKKQINQNKEKYKNFSRIEFIYADIGQYFENTLYDNVLVVSQNSLEYFEQKRLDKIFTLVYKKYTSSMIAVSTYSQYLNIKNSSINPNHSFITYHHNYYALLEKVGYQVKIIDLDKKLDSIVLFSSKPSKI